MITWLDRWIHREILSDGRAAIEAAMGRSARRLSDHVVVGLLLTTHATQLAQMLAPVADNEAASRRILERQPPHKRTCFALLPYARPLLDVDGAGPLCLQVPEELAADLVGARPPAAALDALTEAVHSHGTVYLDFPGAPAEPGKQVLRALFFRWGTPGTLTACAILEDLEERITEIIWPVEGGGMALGAIDGTAPWEEDLPRAQAIGELGMLALLYHRTGEGRSASLPHVSREALEGLNPEHQRQKRRKFSLFNVLRLARPEGRELRPSSGGGWYLEQRVPVKGHFKLQPHGPGKELRRLIWVEAHERGPMGAPRKARLEQM